MSDATNIDDGGPAFPSSMQDLYVDGMAAREGYAELGMTLRDYFAAKVVEGLIANDGGIGASQGKAWEQRTAEVSYRMADAMISARKA